MNTLTAEEKQLLIDWTGWLSRNLSRQSKLKIEMRRISSRIAGDKPLDSFRSELLRLALSKAVDTDIKDERTRGLIASIRGKLYPDADT